MNNNEPLSHRKISENKKKSINDILSNFKKEKEQFDVKLSMLKSKLESISSPERARLQGASPDQYLQSNTLNQMSSTTSGQYNGD